MSVKMDKTRLVKDTLTNYKLVPHIDRAIAQGEFEWSAHFESKHGDDGFHPSSHCLPSPLALYNSIVLDEHEPISGSLRKTFAVGHFWHAYLQHICVEKLGFCGWDEVEQKGTKVWGMNGDGSPKPYHYATGSADIAKCSIPRHGDWLIDFKTMNAIDFRTPGLPNRFYEKYLAQINIYMSFFDMEKALIVKVQKDSPHDLSEIEVYRNQPLIDAIFTKWEITGFHISEKFAPSSELIFSLNFDELRYT